MADMIPEQVVEYAHRQLVKRSRISRWIRVFHKFNMNELKKLKFEIFNVPQSNPVRSKCFINSRKNSDSRVFQLREFPVELFFVFLVRSRKITAQWDWTVIFD